MRDIKPLLICVLYRPPNSSDKFFYILSTMLNKALDLDGEVLVMGDFNCDLLSGKLDSKTQTLVSIMDGSLLTQLIVSPTRVTMNSRTLIIIIIIIIHMTYNAPNPLCRVLKAQ